MSTKMKVLTASVILLAGTAVALAQSDNDQRITTGPQGKTQQMRNAPTAGAVHGGARYGSNYQRARTAQRNANMGTRWDRDARYGRLAPELGDRDYRAAGRPDFAVGGPNYAVGGPDYAVGGPGYFGPGPGGSYYNSDYWRAVGVAPQYAPGAGYYDFAPGPQNYYYNRDYWRGVWNVAPAFMPGPDPYIGTPWYGVAPY